MASSPVILLAPRRFKEPSDLLVSAPIEQDLEKVLGHDLNKYDQLRSYGYDVRVLSASNPSIGSRPFWQYTKRFEEQRPGSVLRIDICSQTEQDAILWPRDTFQTIGDKIYAQPSRVEAACKILTALGVHAGPTSVTASSLGEGGRVVRTRNLLVLSDDHDHYQLTEQSTIPGFTTHYLPTPQLTQREAAESISVRLRTEHETCRTLFTQFLRSLWPKSWKDEELYFRTSAARELADTLYTRMRKTGHIDREFNIISTPDHNLAAIATRPYYLLFKLEVDTLLKNIGARLHVISDYREWTRESLNFVQFPDFRVMLADGCPNTQSWLERVLGKDKVIPVTTFVDDYRCGGGLRCRSNLIEDLDQLRSSPIEKASNPILQTL